MTKIPVEYTGPEPISVQLRAGLTAKWTGPGKVIQLPEEVGLVLINNWAIGGGLFRRAAAEGLPAAEQGKKARK